MSENPMYCDIDAVKERLLIPIEENGEYDDSLTLAVEEATRLINLYLTPYEEELPLEDYEGTVIEDICADLAASIFKRRNLPDEIKLQGQLAADGTNILEAQGWFALGFKKLQEYIKVTYKKGTFLYVNPEAVEEEEE